MKLILFYESIFLFWFSFDITLTTSKIVVKSPNALYSTIMRTMHLGQVNHWGVFLTLTDRQKYQTCEDILKPDAWPITDVDGGDTVSFPLSVVPLQLDRRRMQLGNAITFTCRGIDRSKNKVERTVSYGFSINTFFISAKSRNLALVHSFVVGTAAYIIQPILDLEQFYYDSRLRIDNLEEESPDYIKLIETRNNFSALSDAQKSTLCTEIFQSPYYEWKKVTFNDSSSGKVEYKSVPLFFKKYQLKFKPFEINVMICQVHLPHYKNHIFGLIPSYNHDNSLFVVAGPEEEMYLDLYVKNIVYLTK